MTVEAEAAVGASGDDEVRSVARVLAPGHFQPSAPPLPPGTVQREAAHLSFVQIAAELFVSRNTVKTQAIAVYRKLEVSSRAEAVERARELGLLDALTS